jgi:hypothetical protein
MRHGSPVSLIFPLGFLSPTRCLDRGRPPALVSTASAPALDSLQQPCFLARVMRTVTRHGGAPNCPLGIWLLIATKVTALGVAHSSSSSCALHIDAAVAFSSLPSPAAASHNAPTDISSSPADSSLPPSRPIFLTKRRPSVTCSLLAAQPSGARPRQAFAIGGTPSDAPPSASSTFHHPLPRCLPREEGSILPPLRPTAGRPSWVLPKSQSRRARH